MTSSVLYQQQSEKSWEILTYVPNDDSNQHAHRRSLIKIFKVHMKNYVL